MIYEIVSRQTLSLFFKGKKGREYMGAAEFYIRKKGIYKNAREAFNEAVEDAAYEHGHGGYTGTIAEKNSFREIEIPGRKDVRDFIAECMNDENHFCQDKWGPAACVSLKGDRLAKERDDRYKGKRNFNVFYFFGWASD